MVPTIMKTITIEVTNRRRNFMAYKLIALDMDDTLLTSDKTVSEYNQAAIQKALQQGIKVVLCSGRTHNAMVKFAKPLGITGPEQYMITNGGAIIENMEGKILNQQNLDTPTSHFLKVLSPSSH